MELDFASEVTTLKRPLELLAYADRTPDRPAHEKLPARIEQRLQELIRYADSNDMRKMRAAFMRQQWLTTYLRRIVTRQTRMPPSLLQLLFAFLQGSKVAPTYQAIVRSLLDPRRGQNPTVPRSPEAVAILQMMLETPAYASHLGTLDYPLEYEAALVRGDEQLARILLTSAPTLIRTVLDPSYRSVPGRRFARRIFREQVELLRSRSASEAPSESEEPPSSASDDTLGLLMDLMDASDEDSPPAERRPSSSIQDDASEDELSLTTRMRIEDEDNDLRDPFGLWSLEFDRDRVGAGVHDASTPPDSAPFAHWPSLEKAVTAETAYRHVAFTTPTMQLVFQRLAPAPGPESEVPWEVHAHGTQFVRTEAGLGVAEMEAPDGTITRRTLGPEGTVIIQPGVRHRLRNLSDADPWAFYALYSPPEH